MLKSTLIGGVLRWPLSKWYDPELVYEHLAAPRTNHVWRDQGINAESGISFLGWPTDSSDVLTVEKAAVSRADLRSLTSTMSDRLRNSQSDSATLGWWELLGYELCCAAVDESSRDSPATTAVQFFVDRGIEFDHAARTVTLVILAGAPGAESWGEEVGTALKQTDHESRPATVPEPTVRVEWRHDRPRYLEMIGQCKAAIIRGDAY